MVENKASQAISAETDPVFDQFDIGDSITLKVTIDLPKVPSGSKADLVFELFGMDPDKGGVVLPLNKIRSLL